MKERIDISQYPQRQIDPDEWASLMDALKTGETVVITGIYHDERTCDACTRGHCDLVEELR